MVAETQFTSGASTAGDHVQLFPGAEQRVRPADHFLLPLQPAREQVRRLQNGFAGEAGLHGRGSVPCARPGVCGFVAAGEAWARAELAMCKLELVQGA